MSYVLEMLCYFWKKKGLLYSDYLNCSEISIKEYYNFLCDISKFDPGAVVINGYNGVGLVSNEIPLIDNLLNDIELINETIHKHV